MFLFVLLSAGKKQGEGELEPEAAEVLHEILRPFFLRRTKEEVLKDLPPKTEVILYTGMTTYSLAISFSLLLILRLSYRYVSDAEEVLQMDSHKGRQRTRFDRENHSHEQYPLFPFSFPFPFPFHFLLCFVLLLLF